MQIISLLLLIIFWLTSCGGPEGICLENGRLRPCKAKEIIMIGEINAIIDAVKNYRYDPDDFFRKKQGKGDAEILFFGENHLDILGQLKTFGYINSIARKGDIILLEGMDWRLIDYISMFCGVRLIYDIFLNLQWRKTGRSYEPEKVRAFFMQQNYEEMLAATFSSYDFSELNLNKLVCRNWDDGLSLNRSFRSDSPQPEEVSYRLLKRRNQAQVWSMSFWRPKSRRILVNAGYAHLPSGDKLVTQMLSPGKINDSLSMEDYYRLVKRERKIEASHRSLTLSQGSGSTKPIYDYLMRENISYVEIIPRVSLQ